MRVTLYVVLALQRQVRYLAYSSDVGEAMRPIVPVSVVNATYAIAIGYCAFDVGYEGYKANRDGGDVTRAVVKQTLFQGLASIGLPFVIIHQSVIPLFQENQHNVCTQAQRIHKACIQASRLAHTPHAFLQCGLW